MGDAEAAKVLEDALRPLSAQKRAIVWIAPPHLPYAPALQAAGIDADAVAPQIHDKFISAFVRAQKPAAKSCCGPTCYAN